MRTRSVVWLLTAAVTAGGFAGAGCESAPQSGDPNQALKTQYQEGTGVASSSYQAKPRLYSNPNAPAPTSQPVSR